MKRLFILLTPFMLSACGALSSLNSEKLVSAGTNLLASYTLTDEQVASMCMDLFCPHIAERHPCNAPSWRDNPKRVLPL